METKWAVENLQTIRTLMERSTVYRRALAPVMILAGTTGIIGGLAGWQLELETNTAFVLLWLGVATVALIGALLLVRRQALKDSEPFWSPPTRRVCQALLPAFLVGLMVAAFALLFEGGRGEGNYAVQGLVIMVWTWCYGCAIHAAGFFMPRGVRRLGLIFVLTGGVLPFLISLEENLSTSIYSRLLVSHLFMAAIFGGLHLAYGIYLYLTEKKNTVA